MAENWAFLVHELLGVVANYYHLRAGEGQAVQSKRRVVRRRLPRYVLASAVGLARLVYREGILHRVGAYLLAVNDRAERKIVWVRLGCLLIEDIAEVEGAVFPQCTAIILCCGVNWVPMSSDPSYSELFPLSSSQEEPTVGKIKPYA